MFSGSSNLPDPKDVLLTLLAKLQCVFNYLLLKNKRIFTILNFYLLYILPRFTTSIYVIEINGNKARHKRTRIYS